MIFLAKATLGVTGCLALTTAYVFHEGTIRIDVDENYDGGSHVHFWVPATAVSTGLRFTPSHYLQQAASQTRPYLPVMREVAKELQKYPNAEFVDVKDSTDHVRIAVHNGKLAIDAVSEKEVVHVAVPVEVIDDVADRFESMAPGV
jgi:hypothetical protein